MTDRHDIVRRVYRDGPAFLARVAAADFEPEGDGSLGLSVLRDTFFPELDVEIEELFDAPDDRVVARLTVRTATTADARSWSAVQVWRFRGERIVGVWSLQDALPWLQALGVVEPDEVIERRLDGRPP